MSDTSNLRNLAVSETGFVFDPRSGCTFTLNATGLAILNSLRDGAQIDAIVDDLHRRFDGATEVAKDDVREFVQALQRHGVVSQEFKV